MSGISFRPFLQMEGITSYVSFLIFFICVIPVVVVFSHTFIGAGLSISQLPLLFNFWFYATLCAACHYIVVYIILAPVFANEKTLAIAKFSQSINVFQQSVDSKINTLNKEVRRLSAVMEPSFLSRFQSVSEHNAFFYKRRKRRKFSNINGSSSDDCYSSSRKLSFRSRFPKPSCKVRRKQSRTSSIRVCRRDTDRPQKVNSPRFQRPSQTIRTHSDHRDSDGFNGDRPRRARVNRVFGSKLSWRRKFPDLATAHDSASDSVDGTSSEDSKTFSDSPAIAAVPSNLSSGFHPARRIMTQNERVVTPFREGKMPPIWKQIAHRSYNNMRAIGRLRAFPRPRPIPKIVFHDFAENFLPEFTPPNIHARIHDYVRVNPTIPMKVDHLLKSMDKLSFDPLYRDTYNKILGNTFDFIIKTCDLERMGEALAEHDFESVYIDPTKAVGWPYFPGADRREFREELLSGAEEAFQNSFEDFHKHIWYDAGRTKLMKREQKPRARLAMYQGTSTLMVLSVYFQQLTQLSKVYGPKLGIAAAHSWFNRGANRIASMLTLPGGNPDTQYTYDGDGSSHDAHMQWAHFEPILAGHLKIIRAALQTVKHEELFPKWKKIFTRYYQSKRRRLVQIQGVVIEDNTERQLSGCPATGLDNELIVSGGVQTVFHVNGFPTTITSIVLPKMLDLGEPVVAVAGRGDDIAYSSSDETVADADWFHREMQKVGMNYKPENANVRVGIDGVKFLGKVIYRDHRDPNLWIATRPADEVFLRAYSPDTYEPNIVENQPLYLAQRLCGLLIDAANNPLVRSRFRAALGSLYERHQVDILSLEDMPEILKISPWDLNVEQMQILRSVPAIPSDEFLENLYGHKLCTVYYETDTLSDYLDPIRMSDHTGHATQQSVQYAERTYTSRVEQVVSNTSSRNLKKIKKMLIPFNSSSLLKRPYRTFSAYTAAEFTSDIVTKVGSILLVGSHPGGDAHYFESVAPQADKTIITLFPKQDRHLLPLVSDHANFTIIVKDCADVAVETSFDLLWIDLSVGRYMRSSNKTDFMTYCDPDVILSFLERVHSKIRKRVVMRMDTRLTSEQESRLLSVSDSFSIFRVDQATFSKPWKTEMIVTLERSPVHNRRKSLRRQQLLDVRARIVARSTMWFHYVEVLASTPREIWRSVHYFRDDSRLQSRLRRQCLNKGVGLATTDQVISRLIKICKGRINNPEDFVLDLNYGTGTVTSALREAGFTVKSWDPIGGFVPIQEWIPQPQLEQPRIVFLDPLFRTTSDWNMIVAGIRRLYPMSFVVIHNPKLLFGDFTYDSDGYTRLTVYQPLDRVDLTHIGTYDPHDESYATVFHGRVQNTGLRRKLSSLGFEFVANAADGTVVATTTNCTPPISLGMMDSTRAEIHHISHEHFRTWHHRISDTSQSASNFAKSNNPYRRLFSHLGNQPIF